MLLFLHSKKFFSVCFTLCLVVFATLSAKAQITYSSTFTAGLTPTITQASDWITFRNALVATNPYYKVKISTSAGSQSIECNNATIVADIAAKLRTGVAATWVDGANTWNVGSCGSTTAGTGWELSVNNNGNCQCGTGPCVRPGIGNSNWGGGFGTTTCPSPTTQTLTVEFFYVPPCDTPKNLVVFDLQKSSASFGWSAVTGSLGYEYALSTSSVPPATGAPTSNTTVSRAGLTPGTDYYFHLRNKCTTSDSKWLTLKFTTPICFSTDTLKIGNVTDNSAFASWNNIAIANHYEYLVNQSVTPPTDGTGTTTTVGTSAVLNGLQENTNYVFWIRCKCFSDTDSSEWRSTSFTTRAKCMPPQPVVDNTNPNQPNVSWTEMPYSVGYEHAVTKSSTPPPIGQTIYTNQVSVPLPPANGDGYYFHVRTKCYDIFTMSGWASVELRVPTGINDLKENNAFIKAFPNPVKEKLQIELNTDKGGTITITDLAGKVIFMEEATGKVVNVNMARVAAGVYLIKYKNGNDNKVLKFVKE